MGFGCGRRLSDLCSYTSICFPAARCGAVAPKTLREDLPMPFTCAFGRRGIERLTTMPVINGVNRRFCSAIMRSTLRHRGAILGPGVVFDGFPIVSGCDQGRLEIGAGATLISRSQDTALGVRAPVILRLLAAGAVLRIGADSGLSGTAICAAQRVEIGARCLIGADVMIFDTD